MRSYLLPPPNKAGVYDSQEWTDEDVAWMAKHYGGTADTRPADRTYRVGGNGRVVRKVILDEEGAT